MPAPTVFHITHPKAGSQWVKHILHTLTPHRTLMEHNTNLDLFFARPLQPGKVYPAIYTSKPVFDYVVYFRRDALQDALFLPTQRPLARHTHTYLWNALRFRWLRFPIRRFVVLRDLRDTLVSLYFSLRNTHAILSEKHANYRARLQRLSQEEGLLFLLESEELGEYARIQRSWIGAPETLVVRFEDLIEDPPAWFRRILRFCEMEVPDARLIQVLEAYRFERLSQGRRRGEEDPYSHYRKGVAGDWRHYFTPRLKQAFKDRFGNLLQITGYEAHSEW